MNHKPKISVITVVYNGEKYLEHTIQSVINQTYKNLEYIIIDGGSTDGTIDIIKKYEDKIDYWVNEKDDGIYDAMNKGINKANGEWINFMNSGDSFFNIHTLDNVFKNDSFNNVDILYGDVQVEYGYFKKINKSKTINNIWKGMIFSHQSCFIKSSYHKTNKYTHEYSIAADFNFFYKAFLDKKTFFKLNNIVSIVLNYGVSDRYQTETIKQWFDITSKYHLSAFQRFYYYLQSVNLQSRTIMKNYLPLFLVKIIKKYKY